MNQEDFNLRTNVIQKTFNDMRKIKCIASENTRRVGENVYPGGDIFTTEDGEIIDLEFQETDFDEEELVKYVELAEELYKNNQKHVSIYIICPNNINIRVKECEIMSEADFTIKLACIEEDPCDIILTVIKNKIKNKEPLNEDDIRILTMLPVKCKPEKRKFFLKEYFKIINTYFD